MARRRRVPIKRRERLPALYPLTGTGLFLAIADAYRYSVAF
jgi:hypothetical protein